MIDSIINNDIIEKEELNETADKAEKREDTAAVIKQYGDIIHTKKANIISIAYHQGKDFKNFKDKEKSIKLVSDFKVHKSAIIFKMKIFKLTDKHPKLSKPYVTLGFLKNYHKDIKQISNENSNEFEWVKVIPLRKNF